MGFVMAEGAEGADGNVMSGVAEDCKELQQQFSAAAQFLQTNTKELTSAQLLYLYARYKQVQEGPCCIAKPSVFDPKGRQKWDAWKQLGDMSSTQAMQEYIAEIERLFPTWKPQDQKFPGTGFGSAVSKLQIVQEHDVTQKDIFDWVKEGDITRIKECLEGASILQRVDSEGMTLLHWACDRGMQEAALLLLEAGADVNKQDLEGQTPLHYASSCGHREIVSQLVRHGADCRIADHEGLTAQDVALECSDLFHNT
ncbi:acyl-CoA-binding domain-containing protein 6-like [Ornithodoros turicata]|uniref:acyl-CoA-binding domain-containing protein 6-like n=1 Tax=Ornithodoros turicata TaxID=34597 RepID=UPI00313948AD